MSARKQLEQLGVPADVLDAYRREVFSEAAGVLYDTDSGTCGCGCHCAQLLDPEQPCPHCDDVGGRQLGEACYVCGHVRTTSPEPRGPSPFIPLSFIELLPGLAIGYPPPPRYTGVLEYLQDGDP